MKESLFAAILIVVLCSACSDSKQKKSKRTEAQLAEREAKKLSVLPAPREYTINGSQLIVMKIPVDEYGFISYQRCFLWRDMEFKSASLQCERSPEMDLSEP